MLIVLEVNSKTYDEPPNNKGPDDTQCRCGTRECLSESCKYHDHHFNPIYRKGRLGRCFCGVWLKRTHPSTAKPVGKKPKGELTA